MGFQDEFAGKKEVRFGGQTKFTPDAGNYVLEIQDDMDTKFNEKSGITSLILNLKTVAEVKDGPGDGTNLNITMRLYVPDGIKPAERKLKSLIFFTGQAEYFDSTYEDIPAMDSEKWPAFLKDIKDKLSFKLVGAEIGHRKVGDRIYPDFRAFKQASEPKKTKIRTEQEDFKWEQ